MTQPNWADFLRGTFFPYGKRTEGPNAGEEFKQYGAFGDKNMLPALLAAGATPPPPAPPPEASFTLPPPGSSYPRMLGEGLRAGAGYAGEAVGAANQFLLEKDKQLGDIYGFNQIGQGTTDFARGLFGDNAVDSLLSWLGQGYEEDQIAETVGPLQGPVQQEPAQQGGFDFGAALGGGGGGPAYKMPDWVSSGAQSPSQQSLAVGPTGGPMSERRSKLEERIEQLSRGSSLPEPEFKERLARVLMGLAAGYGAGIAQNPEMGAIGGLGSAFTGGAGESLRYTDEVTRRREQQELQNQRGLAEAASLESNLLRMDTADARAITNQQLRAREIDLLGESIKQKQAALMQRAQGDPIKRIREAIGLRMDIEKYNRLMEESKFDDVKIMTNSGEVPIGALDPTSQRAARAAVTASFSHPALFNRTYADVMKEMEESGALASAGLLGQKPEDMIRKEVTARIMQYYLSQGTPDGR